MARILADDDVEAIALRVVELIGARLAPIAKPSPPPPAATKKPLPEKMAFTLKELSVELGISKVTLYRLEARGLIRPLPYLRTKIFARKEVERFLADGIMK